jgi:hypothetical protein
VSENPGPSQIVVRNVQESGGDVIPAKLRPEYNDGDCHENERGGENTKSAADIKLAQINRLRLLPLAQQNAVIRYPEMTKNMLTPVAANW